MSEPKTVAYGPSAITLVLGMFSVLLVGLKLTGHIDASWFVVMSPFLCAFAPLGLIGLLFVVAGLLLLVGSALSVARGGER